MSGRNNQVSRLFCIINVLENNSHGMTVKELHSSVIARGHDAAERTVYRDLEALDAAGFPVFQMADANQEGSRWYLGKTTQLTKTLILDARELFALFLSQGALTPLRQTPFYADLDRAFKKIEDKLAPIHADYLKDLKDELKFDPKPAWGLSVKSHIVDTIHAACSEGHILKISYKSGNDLEPRDRRLGPHYLYYAKQALYLIAADLQSGELKTYSLARVIDAEMLDEPYSGNSVSPEILFRDSFGIFHGEDPVSVRVQFDLPAAAYVSERIWHESQKTIQLENGRVELQLNVALTPDLVHWVMRFGKAALVKEPASLKKEICDALELTLARYK